MAPHSKLTWNRTALRTAVALIAGMVAGLVVNIGGIILAPPYSEHTVFFHLLVAALPPVIVFLLCLWRRPTGKPWGCIPVLLLAVIVALNYAGIVLAANPLRRLVGCEPEIQPGLAVHSNCFCDIGGTEGAQRCTVYGPAFSPLLWSTGGWDTTIPSPIP